MTVLYVDVSHHDWSRHGGQLDWAKVKAATSPAMCARATYGDPAGFNPTSRYFGSFTAAARTAGFDLLGAYHDLIRGDQASINRQVDYLRQEMDKAGANWAMLDVERYEELLTRSLHPRFEDAVRFADRWRAVDGRVLTVYLPKWIWDGHMGRPDLRKLASPLVASNYGGNPDGSPAGVYRARGGDAGVGWNAYGGVTPSIWQFGSQIDCPGASGATDVNAFRGSLAELRALLTGQPLEDDMPLTDTDVTKAANAVWAATALEYVDQAGDGTRDPRTVKDILFSIHALAVAQANPEALASSIAAKLSGVGGTVTDEQLTRVLRSVFGSLDDTPQS